MKESPLFAKSYDLSKWLMGRTSTFPKNQRFVLARRIEDACFGLHDNLIFAVKLPARRPEFLSLADAELERLRHYLRMGIDMKLLALNQYEYALREMDEIGKMLGSWLKKV